MHPNSFSTDHSKAVPVLQFLKFEFVSASRVSIVTFVLSSFASHPFFRCFVAAVLPNKFSEYLLL